MPSEELDDTTAAHAFNVTFAGFTIENGLLTANGKLRRSAINTRYASEIDAMYDAKGVREAAGGKRA